MLISLLTDRRNLRRTICGTTLLLQVQVHHLVNNPENNPAKQLFYKTSVSTTGSSFLFIIYTFASLSVKILLNSLLNKNEHRVHWKK